MPEACPAMADGVCPRYVDGADWCAGYSCDEWSSDPDDLDDDPFAAAHAAITEISDAATEAMSLVAEVASDMHATLQEALGKLRRDLGLPANRAERRALTRAARKPGRPKRKR